MNISRWLALLIAFAPCCTLGGDGKSGVSQNPAQLDDDFFLQGEFAGTLQTADCGPAPAGLQVIALGDGDFQAVEFAGGLPGNGWDGRTRRKYSGRTTSAGVAELTGEGRTLRVRRSQAAVTDSTGRTLGRLEKVLRMSQTLRARRPLGARALFNGFDARHFAGGAVTPDHFLVAGADTKQSFGDFTMHLEFRTPYMPKARGQARGNSGVYIQGRYEVQILDSFGLEGANNECGGLYKQRAPLVNMCFPPLAWQTYDIDFTTPRFDAAGRKIANACITVRHNGVVVQNNVEITAKTGGGAPEGPASRPIRLQDHGNPVHFRNLWIVERKTSANVEVTSEN
jgi:hypothetical protein